MAPVRERDAGGNGGGFAPLEASCRRVVGVSRLYWCNSPRLVVPSTWGELDRVPLTVQVPLFGGGFAPLEASCRRVVGVSWLYWCNSPRLVVPSTWGELDRVPLTAQVPLFGGGFAA